MLGYAEYGEPRAKPVFLFHGTPGSRRMRHPDESIHSALHARIICTDRPGYGLSDFQPGRRLLDWPQDIVQLADALQIERFAVAGLSGGGPHTAACAYSIPDRIVAAALISSLSPFLSPDSYRGMVWPVGILLRIATVAPWLPRLLAWPWIRSSQRNFDSYMDRVASRLPKPDAEVLRRGEVRNIFRESLAEMFRQGTRGAAQEMAILAKPWEFRLQDIHIPVAVWHGEEDTFHKGHFLAENLPNCEAHFFKDEGHLLFFNRWQEILGSIVQQF